jgi:hypothetical protein
MLAVVGCVLLPVFVWLPSSCARTPEYSAMHRAAAANDDTHDHCCAPLCEDALRMRHTVRTLLPLTRLPPNCVQPVGGVMAPGEAKKLTTATRKFPAVVGDAQEAETVVIPPPPWLLFCPLAC